MSKFVQELTE